MSDDLVKRLRGWPGKRGTGPLSCTMDEAADRIEKLEAALQRANANVEEYERKFYLGADRIEKLEADVSTARRTSNYWKMEHLEGNKRIEKLEDALHTIYKCCDETGNCSVVRRIVRKALEGKDD